MIKTICIKNTRTLPMTIGIEPEGHYFDLLPGEAMDFYCDGVPADGDPYHLVAWEESGLVVYTTQTKRVIKDGSVLVEY